MNDSIKQILLNAKAQIENQKSTIFEAENAANFDSVVRPQLEEADIKFNAAVEELRMQNEARKEHIRLDENQKIKAKIDGEFNAVLVGLDMQINGALNS